MVEDMYIIDIKNDAFPITLEEGEKLIELLYSGIANG
jgi:hypothetical protein